MSKVTIELDLKDALTLCAAFDIFKHPLATEISDFDKLRITRYGNEVISHIMEKIDNLVYAYAQNSDRVGEPLSNYKALLRMQYAKLGIKKVQRNVEHNEIPF
jgi:hypothetical protein